MEAFCINKLSLFIQTYFTQLLYLCSKTFFNGFRFWDLKCLCWLWNFNSDWRRFRFKIELLELGEIGVFLEWIEGMGGGRLAVLFLFGFVFWFGLLLFLF